MCLAKGHNAVMPVRLQPAAPWSRVKHSTIESLHPPYFGFLIKISTESYKSNMVFMIAYIPIFDDVCFVSVDVSHTSQQFFRHVKTFFCLPGLNKN